MARANACDIHEKQHERFSEEMFSLPRSAPAKDSRPRVGNFIGATCPFCEQRILPTRISMASLFSGGIRRLFVAMVMILGAVFRCARFILGGCFCLIGLIGTCCRTVGLRIVHPDDRSLLSPCCGEGRSPRP